MRQTPPHTNLALNIAPVLIPDAAVPVGILKYNSQTGHEDLARLRTKYRGTHAVTRSRDQILCVPRIPNAALVGDSQARLHLRENLGLAGALLRESLIDHFCALGRQVTRHRPISFLSNIDVLKDALPDGIQQPEWLAIFPLYELDVRLFFFGKAKPFLGVALDSRTRRRVTATCAELINAGINLEGHYVGRRRSEEDERLEARFELLGRVSAIEHHQLRLDDSREGVSVFQAGDCLPEPSAHTFNSLIAQLFPDQTDAILKNIFQKSAERRVGPTKLQDLRRVGAYLQKQTFEVSPGVTLTIGGLLDGNAVPRLEDAPRPVYVFDPTGAKTDTWSDGGIRKYGPYSQQTFSKNRPRIAVVCQSSAKGRVEQFLQKFFSGQSHPKKNPGPFDNGLVGKYRLDGVSLKFFLANGSSAVAYQQAAQQAISEQERWDLALVQIEKTFRDLEGEANPYLVTKHAFLAHQTPVQEFTLETASLWDGQLAYALNNMALATYSKLGGTPWLLRCDRTIAHELVIGIGSAQVGHGRLGDRERVVGFTTVFSGDGDYRVANRSEAAPYAQYGEALLSTLKATVEAVARDMNWQDGDHVRLVFHALKPFRDVEAGAVKSLMDSLGRYDVEFAFVEISQQHPYLLFDEGQKGVRDFDSGSTKGAFAPQRGKTLDLSKSEVLLVLTGPNDVKRPQDGLPSPVLLRLHRQSTFTDMTYLSRQVYAFAHHSWRSFFPGSLPVTVQYSELIAGLLGELSQLPNWNPDILWGRVGRTRWFL
jgi:hypothetical protein